MSSDDDDYLSEKFLVDTATTSAKPNTYSQLRKEAQKKAHLKNEQNRTKPLRQRELEAREEGLSKSLFERAKEEEAAGIGSGNKALSIMMKMGFKPGQSLGNAGHLQQAVDDDSQHHGESSSKSPTLTSPHAGDEQLRPTPPVSETSTPKRDTSPPSGTHTTHKTEPLPLQEWAGRKGIGLLGTKRARSPSAPERMAKMAKLAEDMGHRDFRDRARDEYNNRRAEGRLVPAQRTCCTLDEQMGKPFNVLWLNPSNPTTFPPGLIDALALHSATSILPETQGENLQSRLKKQMQADALQPISGDDDLANDAEALDGLAAKTQSSSVAVVQAEDHYSPELLEEATQFLRLQAQDRLHLVLSYLREKHCYCFWCGVEYGDHEELEEQCPGQNEDDHD